MSYLEMLNEDVRFRDGLKACISCGVCTAICPAAEFFDYDPRKVMIIVQKHREEEIESLLRGETIWNCGQCMSCKTRCPRENTPGMVIQALRKVSQESGLFVHSVKGRQQLKVKRSVGDNILEYGYCVHPDTLLPDQHPEQGTVWEWIYENRKEVYERLGANIYREGAGAVRKIDDESMEELRAIFRETGGERMFQLIEYYSEE
ncbi:MAG TPA: 4Fe-4S dicluster domain-containing protein [Prolixibacteraceae bacterium]|jgi:heterodisulfide reductase subunit C|nr:4Fe-4S dicluster domain-containing protein [Bacteroidales bacterium]OQB81181.1 MAG: succinate dehydrogenase/fumarate reductase iron-sulfur subunit [Bacteroidetes bacterium ADurb.Bin123]HNU77842.1 4Fe-4S dicluster domain-containing protein [Prolixibacteraceae bacterium]HNZ68509.1 4Fe-4S dicluster domain-containing protein [Prolixibacteraceae bacterium]HOC86075.1 4Fe-4S dicluster domain-containing protein [Prolixibacteraceae bacterium]